MLYHVSEKPGLKVLRPHVSSHGRAYVYAVDDLVTGLLFGAGHDDFDLYLSNDAAGVPTVRECWPGAFQKVYQGKRCSVYEVDEAGFQRGVTSWDPELVHEGEVAVERETVVDDLYRRLLEEGGVFLCSGVLNVRLDEVKAALEAAGLTITGCNQMDDWCQLSATC